MNAALEILKKILEGLHQSFSTKKEESNNIWDHLDCASDDCITHSLFEIKILERVACYLLRKKKITHMDRSFDKLLKLVKMDDQFTCNPEEGGCGKLNSIVLEWQSVRENALTTEIDNAVMYAGLDEGRKHHLIAMVCFQSRYLTCFAYDHEHKNWVHYNDKIVEVIDHCKMLLLSVNKGTFYLSFSSMKLLWMNDNGL